MKRWFFFFLLYCISAFPLLAQNRSFEEIRKKYENRATDDERAMPYVQKYIQKAKNEKNYEKWVQGYRDGVQFSKNSHTKMLYADSTVTVALRSQDNQLIANAYLGRGIVLYFNMKKFQPALGQYLIAQKFAENTEDEYLKNKIVYHIGVVKSYLGFYEPASEHFMSCIAFFEKRMMTVKEPVKHYNYKRAYLNSIHQLTVVYRNLGQWKRSDSLIQKGLMEIGNDDSFPLEKAYFYNCMGIAELNKRQYNSAVFYLDKALPQILKRDDFAGASVVYFYRGNIFWKTDEKRKAIRNFQKIDSIFCKRKFIVPEVRHAYDKLIVYAQETDDLKQERYYTRQMLKVDSFLAKDFAFLSAKIHKDYDRKKDLQEKKQWQVTRVTDWTVIIVLLAFTAGLIVTLLMYRRKKLAVLNKYRLLQERWAEQNNLIKVTETTSKKSGLPIDVVNSLTVKLNRFEENEGFRDKKLTLIELAKNLGTNTNYLSVFINETRGMYFKPYLMNLRINYIIKKLNEDKKYKLLTIAALAEDAGFNHRQSFSVAFLEITKLRPAEYIRQMKMKSTDNELKEESI